MPSIGKVVKAIVAVPFGLAAGVSVLAVWAAATMTGIGPLLQWLAKRSDAKLLSSAAGRFKTVRSGEAVDEFMVLAAPSGVNLAVRYTASKAPRHRYPICIPNGLAATMATIGGIHGTSDAHVLICVPLSGHAAVPSCGSTDGVWCVGGRVRRW